MPGLLAAVSVQLLSVPQEILSDRKKHFINHADRFSCIDAVDDRLIFTWVWVSFPTVHTRSVNIYKKD